MITLITHACCCCRNRHVIRSHGNEKIEAFQRSGWFMHIAIAIDVIVGFGLIVAGLMRGSPLMAGMGGLMSWPLLAYITLTCLACKEDRMDKDIMLRFQPCCRRRRADAI